MKVYRQKIPYWLLVQLAKTKNKFSIRLENTYDPIKDVPIIFAANHTNCYDFPITATAVGRHVYVLVGKQRLGFLDRFFFSLNGVVYADRLNKTDTALVKKAIVNLLKHNKAICWYPEGTWKLSDNLLMLPMKWGIIDVAKQAGAQIIPVGLVYDREEMICHVRFGTPMAGDDFVNNKRAIEHLRDAMATLRWDLMSQIPVLPKEVINRERLKENIMVAIKEYPPIEPEYENQCVFHPYVTVDVVPTTIVPSHENAFLFCKSLS